jgi:hypothetical protein
MAGLPFTLTVLFAVPTTKEAFLQSASAVPPGDYVRGVLGKRTPEAAWSAKEGYWRVAEAATRLGDQAAELGGQVVHGARRTDLIRATETSDVVILCAHWRGDPVSQADLVGPPRAIVAALHDAPGREGEVLRAASSDLLPPREGEEPAWRRQAARMLNGLIASSAFDDALGLSDEDGCKAIGAALARAVIDETLGPLVAPGNRLELADGLWTEADVDAAVASDFGGELDLSVCKSVFLARFLGASRADHKPRPIFHHGLNLLLPHPRLAVLGNVLALCASAGLPFHEARARVEAAFIDAFQQGHKKRGGTLWAWLKF